MAEKRETTIGEHLIQGVKGNWLDLAVASNLEDTRGCLEIREEEMDSIRLEKSQVYL